MCFFIMRALGELLLSNLNHHSFIDFVEDYLGIEQPLSRDGHTGSAGFH